ncbi:MAG: alpha-galactosidase [Parabacteroides gordonii]|nr:alpha-galactosidase [Parabacteroides gordonii]
MTRNKTYLLTLILSGAAWVCPDLTGQTSFVYEKGKMFTDVTASQMEHSIGLGTQQTPVYYEKNIPGKQQTVSYRIEIPAYKQGIFFSRDSRPGDYQWPNNTNRLLPWVFNRLDDLTQEDYPGIPSNGAPSVLGDALLLELADGEFLFAKAVAGENSISWFQVNKDGSLTVYLSTLGTDNLASQAPVLLAEKGKTVYDAIHKAYTTLIGNREISALQKRTDKGYFEAFNYLGWCSWEHYHFDIDETKMLNDLDGIEASGLPIRYVLIDDGHLANKNRQLTSFVPDKERFPNGWKNIISRKKEDKIKWMGLWYNFCGYWMGISPENDFPEKIKETLYSYNGSMLPGKSKENIGTFYQYYIGTLKDYGFDFLKIDNQSFLLPLYMGNTEVIRQAKACNLALEEQTHNQQVGLMNCMAQNILNIDHTQYSNPARVSIDYKKYDEDMAKSHLFQSYTNTLLQGQTVWPDHDMFHSSDTICGSLMARSKAISGGPVYLSDSPVDFVKENILPLIDEEGRIFRPEAPAIPTPESVITNPLKDGKAYRVFAPTGNEAVSLICYNLNTSPSHHQVETTISPADYSLRETMSGKAAPQAERILLYDWEKQTAEVLTADKQIALEGFTDRLFHLCPIRNGWAVVGIQEKFLSPATVEVISSSSKQLKLNVLCPGNLRVWAEGNSQQELRTIPVSHPGKITINK